ncbi:B3 domain-containing protein [Abeliophyllum distichum]|uniref:B3 domain-containing protein n=1 Tax=Abeliophyllum distichum TaxID=126358 RepID=A0ABD1P984_9LAMI
MHASEERIRQNSQKWDGQEKRQNHTGNLIKVVKEEVKVELEEEEEPAVPISQNYQVNEEDVEFKQQERREGVSTVPTSESEDDMTIDQYFRSKGKQIRSSSVGELETPLEASERPLGTKRKFQCLDYDTEEEAHLNSRSPKRERKMEMMENVDGNFRDIHSFAIERAKEVQSKLDSRFPSFFKLMLRSHVSGGFWLHIPSCFCKLNMPKHDQRIVLEDETGKAYEVNYLSGKMALSAGWRGFSIRHNLLAGDVVVFHLVHFDKFKVYIVRASSSGEIGEAIGNSNLDAHAEERHPGLHGTRCISEEEKSNSSNYTNARDEYENDEYSPSKNVGVGSQKNFIEFQEFHIIVNGDIIDSLLTEDMRRNYYELCLARDSYLHDLLKSDNNMLAAGIISETTKIANYIKGCNLSTSSDDFATWDKTLEGFKVLGMDVGFLRSRLSYLVSIATKMRETLGSKRWRSRDLSSYLKKKLIPHGHKIHDRENLLCLKIGHWRLELGQKLGNLPQSSSATEGSSNNQFGL